MRRLPVFLVVDVSESMAGDPLYRLEEGIGAIAAALRQDPYALESAHLSVIAFAGRARTLLPPTELFAFRPPELPIGGGTALGGALEHLMDEIDRTVVRTAAERKGDWKPIVFLLTDGHPTDDTSAALRRWNADYRERATLVAVSVGGGADHALLERLTDHVMVLDDAAPDAWRRFIRWISQSIQATSRGIAEGGGVTLTKTDDVPITSSREAAPSGRDGVDDRYAVFVGRCSQSTHPYLVRYRRHSGRLETDDPVLANLLETRRYVLDLAVPLKNSYFELSDASGPGRSLNTLDIIGQPPCPHCQARFAMAICGCGGLHCIEGDGDAICPWCGKTGTYRGSTGDDGGLDLSRGRG